MFATTFGRRVVSAMKRHRLRGSKRPPRSRSWWKVVVAAEKSRERVGGAYSMSKARRCCLRRRRCLRRKSWASRGVVGVVGVVRRVEAWVRERVVWWTI